MYDRQVGPTNDFIEFEREETEQSIPECFEKQVAKYGHRIAVRDECHELTYHELNKTANCIGLAILEQRSEGQEPIALLLSQGNPVAAGILGVLKAGKIYVPLDPSHPRARLSYILEDSQAGLLVTDTKNLPLAHELAQSGLQLINIDEIDSGSYIADPGLSIPPDSLVYIFYTSGSTGQPKGVVQNHRNLLNGLMRQTSDLHICADDRYALLAWSAGGIFSAILKGAGAFSFNIKEEGLANLADWLTG
ncbi:AMP-binding protein [Candidatus Poribacteria bacterium]